MAKRKFHKNILRSRKAKFLIALEVLGALVLLGLLSLFLVFIYYVKDFPRPEVFTERELTQSTKIYDKNGATLLYEIYGEEKRTWIPLDAMSKYLKEAIVTTEDSHFYSHFGVDFKGIIRAVLFDLKIGKLTYGGSTIPQQLIRSTFLSNEKTAERKTREVILALELDRRYSKDQILEWYLNQIPFGQNAYGVEAASQTYFGKSSVDISLPEAATLAALIKAPSYLSPYGENKKELLERKNYVLERMASEGYINNDEVEKARQEEIKFVERKISIKAPHFTLWVKKELEEKYGEDFLKENGLKVYTSLDWNLQKIAEDMVTEGVKKNKTYNAHNGSLVAIDPETGEILAMVGSAIKSEDYPGKSYPEGCEAGKDCLFDPEFNVVLGNPGRQPGSAFKPFVYATAFEKGYNDKTTVVDEPTNFGLWGDEEFIPQNYDGKFRGEVTLRQALAQSLNVPSVKVLLDLAGLEDSVKTAQDLGIATLRPPYGPSIVLGGWEVKLLEMTSAYGVFATEGLKVSPVSIIKIVDKDDNIIYENKKMPERVLESKVAKLVNDILADNEARAPIFGLRSNMYFENYKVSAKTGTTENYKDGWIIGYTPSVVVGVWVGNNNNTPMGKEPGVVLAGPIFHQFMDYVLGSLNGH